MKKTLMISLALFGATAFSEAEYMFMERLQTPHLTDRRDMSAKAAKGEFAFRDGAVLEFCDDPLVRRGVEDFADYLKVSMCLKECRAQQSSTRTRSKRAALSVTLAKGLPARGSEIETGPGGVKVRAADGRAAMQALFHLEDLMNLRRGPYLKFGKEKRRAVFSPRMASLGTCGKDAFSDGALSVLAHAGFDATFFGLRGVDKVGYGKEPTDVNARIELAASWGLDTYVLSHMKAVKHPDDPASPAELARTYGAVAKKHKGIKGFILVPESNYFESRDPRVKSKDSATDAKGKPKPAPSTFPCSDYPQWLSKVEATLRAEMPDVDFVFWTYNFYWAPEADRFALIDALSPTTILNVTFALGNWREHKTRLGAYFPVADYSISSPGPSALFRRESEHAHGRGRRIFTTCNTGGRTWDFGCCTYEPVPQQWKRRFDALRKAREGVGLSGLIETWQYGFAPNMVAELAKEAFTEGGMDFDAHLRAIAARDYGERHADEVVSIWADFSEAIQDYTATGVNQYGPFRVGPAYPYNALGPFQPFREGWTNFTSWICNPNYGWTIPWGGGTTQKRRPMNVGEHRVEMQLFRSAGPKFVDGAAKLRSFADALSGERRARARRDADVAEYIGRSFLTTANVKEGLVNELVCIDEKKSEEERAAAKKRIFEVARDEYENTLATLPLVEENSHLGWMDGGSKYAGGKVRLEWKLRHMEKLYGIERRR